MTDTSLKCPNCSSNIPLTEALSAQIRAQIEARTAHEHAVQLRQAVEQAQRSAQENIDAQLADLRIQLQQKTQFARETESQALEFKRRAMALEEGQRTEIERVRLELIEKFQNETEQRVLSQVQAAAERARGEVMLELKLANEQLTEQGLKLADFQDRELTLRRQAAALEDRVRGVDLEIARRVAEQKSTIESSIRNALGEEQSLKLLEKDKQLDDMRKVIDDLKRKSEQGSQELQGEVLELNLQSVLARLFPQDNITPVAKGTTGADLIQTVYDSNGKECGLIIWESKNTRRWQSGWLPKLRDDQRAAGANLAVLVSAALPEHLQGFGQLEGVWISSIQVFPAVACALREQIIQVAFAQSAVHGKEEKMELIYNYLAGDQFKQKVQGIVEAFTSLREQTDRERRAMEKLWKEREKQIERVITNTVGMYGEMSGILGSAMQMIPALELDAKLSLEEIPERA